MLIWLLLLAAAPPARAGDRTVVVPWIAQADPDKAVQHESALSVHNPGPGALTVDVTFFKQGFPEDLPPRVTLTLEELETLHLGNVLIELFGRPNIQGFLLVEPTDGAARPIVLSIHRTFREGDVYGQTIPGVALDQAARAGDVFHLVGLHDTDERIGLFGVTNPIDARLAYRLRFFDSLGRPLAATDEPLKISRLGQKQFRVEDVRSDFGVGGLEDYRVVVEPVGPSRPVVPYGTNFRLGSLDPSFLRPGRTAAREVFLLGVLNTPGLNDSLFATDLVLANTAPDPAAVDVTFTGAGFRTEPTEPLAVPLPPGETRRLRNVISEWDTTSGVGVLRCVAAGDAGPYPVAQAESYDVSDPSRVYGQFMPALRREDAARPGSPRTLVGLRQDAAFLAGTRTTLWLYNPEDAPARFSLRYLDHDGAEIGVTDGRLGAGKLRQINPGHHPLPPAGAPGGFVVRLEVGDGALLMAGQVVNEFNDPAYVVAQ